MFALAVDGFILDFPAIQVEDVQIFAALRTSSFADSASIVFRGLLTQQMEGIMKSCFDMLREIFIYYLHMSF
jgi:hypothetical protein